MSRVCFDENGSIHGFPYHDGSLLGVLTDAKSRDIHLALCAVSGEQRILSLRNVKAMDVSGFREGNIVLDLSIFPAKRVANIAEVLKKLEERLFITEANLPPETLVFWLVSSYGAEILAVCDDVEVGEVGSRLALNKP